MHERLAVIEIFMQIPDDNRDRKKERGGGEEANKLHRCDYPRHVKEGQNKRVRWIYRM